MEPAAIRYNNPGAMWGNALATKWGAAPKGVVLHDGLGQGNNIAVFPDKIHGAAAQFDLWHSSANYRNKTLAAALKTWSGGNYTESYIAFLTGRVPGLTRDTVIDEAFLRSDRGWQMMKAQAWHESGKPYPMSDDDWKAAQALVFSGNQPSVPSGTSPIQVKKPSKAVKKAAGAIVVIGATHTAAQASGLSTGLSVALAGVAALILVGIFLWKRND